MIVIENEWITMSDGTRLAAKIWLPNCTETQKIPAVLEYIPYRKRGGTEIRDDLCFPFLANNGYAGIRVDIRGNGESDGFMEDEYTQIELDDGVAVINWIANQSWCTGKVGMIGHSWGAFNDLQIAALQPEPLKAVISSCGTDNRYLDDIHTMHGATLTDQLTWSQQMFAYSSRPPDPDIVGEDWQKIWKNRLEKLPFLAKNWFEHPHRDEFWKHGSVCEDYSKIKAPVLAIGGWYDTYTNSILRLMNGLKAPCRGIIGPWEHKYPYLVKNTPNIDFFAEMLYWFDCWLKDINNGADKQPKIQYFLMENAPANGKFSRREGYWATSNQWPPEKPVFLSYYLGQNTLKTTSEEKPLQFDVCTSQDTGLMAGNFCPGMRIDDELPENQIPDDDKSVIFDSTILEEDVIIFGTPTLELTFTASSPEALIALRLCEVKSANESVRVSHQVFNLCHYKSYEFPEALIPGKKYSVTIPLCDSGYTFKKGNKIRLAISNTYWPLIFPSAKSVTLHILSKGTKLNLPIQISPQKADVSESPSYQTPHHEFLRNMHNTKKVFTDDEGFEVVLIDDDMGEVFNRESKLITDSKAKHLYKIKTNNPLSALVEASWQIIMKRGDWQIKTETTSRATVDEDNFHLYSKIVAYNGSNIFFKKEKYEVVKRKFT